MSIVYTNIKNKKLTVETSNTKSLTTRRVVGRWWQSLNQQKYYKSAAYATWYLQTFITSAHCIVDLPTANYRFGIFQTFITNGHCVVDLPTANYRFGIFL